MASAAAVSADIDRPPIDNDLDESGGVTSTIIPNDPAEEDDDEDEDIQRKGRRTDRVNQANGDDDEDPGELDDDDLFGDDDDALPEEPTAEAPRRELDDEDLDSGDDEGRLDRIGHDGAEEEQEMQEQEKIVMDLDLPRQAGPEPSDGEMYILKVPDFMSLNSKAWRPSDFQPPATDHHSKTPSTTFSPYNTAMTTLRWRRSPTDPSEIQSNARILRWSDGSLTVQLASDPLTQYETNANSLAPPQRNPIKPTPTSINKISGRGGRPGASTAQGGSALAEQYNEKKDTFTYLIAPYPAVGSLRVSNKVTVGLKIKQSASIVDDAITQLQTSLAAASNASRVQGTSGDLMIVDEDPELARRRAELAEREKARARKRNEAQKERENERMGRTAGRFGSSRSGGLNASMLEDDEELGFASQGRVGKGGAKPKRPRQRRANSEYSSDEDYGRRGFQSKADEYDEEDDFVARSDEEEIVEDDDDDDDDGIREGSPKRGRGGDDDEDAAGEDDDEAPVQAAKKRRKVVLDDEEED